MKKQSDPASIGDVVEAGLCIGCGLCEALQPQRWKMTYTPEGRLRPKEIGSGDDAEILSACPGVIIRPNDDDASHSDIIWGKYYHMQEAWAGDGDVRFRSATGGVLTAIAMHLLETGKAKFILHCAADPDAPMRSKWFFSETPEQVLERAGSRYGPSDTLAGLQKAIDRDEPFAIIAKPCDCNAVRERQRVDENLDRNLVALLTLVCGGASDLGKSRALIEEEGIAEEDVTLFRYRGFGNPGKTRVETVDRVVERTYNQMWEDESGWRIQTRCKICADALGEAADLAAADIWQDANPQGEDEGFNGVVTRTKAGEALFEASMETGHLVPGKGITADEFSGYQPHQVKKKLALAARLRGMERAGSCVYVHEGLRLEELDSASKSEEQGAFDRVISGRFSEEMPK